jgi:drug/metabolite transporter (DMT)-like permease
MDGWYSKSILLLFILAFQDIVHRYLMKEGFRAIELVLYGFIPTIIATIIYIYYKKIKLNPVNTTSGSLFIMSGLLSFFGFLLLRQAQIESPNIGYVNAIAYSSLLLTILLTALIFKDAISIYGYLGGFFIIIGIFLIAKTK